jgi:aminoglycoside/choline kinase family phosphotransferase
MLDREQKTGLQTGRYFLSKQHYQTFVQWVSAFLPEATQWDSCTGLQMDALAGDAGFRRYYRTNTVPSFIAVDSPPDKEKNQAYVNIAMALQSQGIRTPVIYAVDFVQGFLLLEDFGTQVLQPLLSEETLGNYYQQAETSILAIQQIQPQVIFPNYDAELLSAEMGLFSQWFVGELLGQSLSQDEIAMLDNLYGLLVRSALEQPQVLVHRDYHSRNLMLLADNQLGIIDFQDAVWGPVTYDLVSLLKDCYVRWPAEKIRQRALNFKGQLQRAGTLMATDDQQFLNWFELMGLQRHIKVMGIFARLSLRDGKAAYLDDLPLVIRYSLEAAQAHPDTQVFADWFTQRIEPQLAGQSWYRDWRTAGDPK